MSEWLVRSHTAGTNGAILVGPHSRCWNQVVHPRSWLSVLCLLCDWPVSASYRPPLLDQSFWLSHTTEAAGSCIFTIHKKKKLCSYYYSQNSLFKLFLWGSWETSWNILKFNFIKKEGKRKGGREGGRSWIQEWKVRSVYPFPWLVLIKLPPPGTLFHFLPGKN